MAVTIASASFYRRPSFCVACSRRLEHGLRQPRRHPAGLAKRMREPIAPQPPLHARGIAAYPRPAPRRRAPRIDGDDTLAIPHQPYQLILPARLAASDARPDGTV